MRVLTACSSVKTVDTPGGLLARNLPEGSLGSVSAEWLRRLGVAAPVVEAASLYGGRGFGHAAAAAGGRPWVVSAGLGLLQPYASVPSYGLTVAAGPEDDVFRRIADRRDHAAWWRTLRSSPYASSIHELFDGEGPVLASLSAPYLAMVADDLAALPEPDLSRLRIFTATAAPAIDVRLRHLVMPCGNTDAIGAYGGVVADYAQRALRHFAEEILPLAPEADAATHAGMMSGAPAPSHGPSFR